MIEARPPVLVSAALPRHVALIMDGNRRWAAGRGLAPIEGHRRGLRSLQRIVGAAADLGIENLTVYAFSEENWGRARSEVDGLFDLAGSFARNEGMRLAREGIRVRTLGRRDRLPAALGRALDALAERTAAGERLTLNLAIDYGGRSELCEAVRAIARDVVAGTLDPHAIDEDAIARRLWTQGLPDPDLLIRTGGELRLSNFLLYQCAYTELWSTPTPWPEFSERSFREALDAYGRRQRRFGR